MTHAEATKDDRRGNLSSCPGELAEMGSYPDRIWVDGKPVDRTVTPWYCAGCEKIVCVVGGTGEVLNVYQR